MTSNKPYAAKPSVMLKALMHERDDIQAQLAMKPETLRANLAAVERLIAIFQQRANVSAQDAQPKALKQAAKLRADVHSNGNGHGPTVPLTLSKSAQIRTRQIALLQLITKGPISTPALMAEVKAMTGSNTAKGATGIFVRNGYMSRDKQGVYTITPKGRARLSDLQQQAP